MKRMPILVYLLATSVGMTAPIILLLLVARRRINRLAGCALLAAAFAGSSAYTLWRMEWFDVWRHGVPGLNLLLVYMCYSAVFGAIGWFLARAILLSPRRGVPMQRRVGG